MKVDGTVSRLATTLSLLMLASSAAAASASAATDPETATAAENMTDSKSLLELWGDLPLGESCDPNAESNQYIIQFKPSTMGIMESICQYQWDQAIDDFDFAAAIPAILDEIKKLNNSFSDFGVDVDTSAVKYLLQITEDDLNNFMDNYAEFAARYQNFLCDQARTFLSTLDFMTVGTTYTEPFEYLLDVMSDYVELVDRNSPVQLMEPRTVQIPQLWGLDRIDNIEDTNDATYDAPGAGNGAHVYIIDTGINSAHSEFTGRIGNGRDFIDNDDDPEDCQGHGTHCAGTAVGRTYGVAPGATLHGVRVLSCSGSGSGAGVISGMDWVATNQIQPAVASMSLGGGFSTASNNAVARLYTAGVVVTTAAGNSNDDACNHSPASAPRSYTVGSMTNSDDRSSFSGYGTCVNIFAPGSFIKSAWIGGSDAVNTISGTSMATPHVAGAMAVYLGLYGIKPPADTIAMLDSVAAYNKIVLDGPSATVSPNKLLQVTFPLACTPQAGTPDRNCVMSNWTGFSTCSTTCGPGTQSRTRTVESPATGCGTCFDANALSETQACQVASCPQSEPTFFGTTSEAEFLQYKTVTYTPINATEYSMTSTCAATESMPYETDTHTPSPWVTKPARSSRLAPVWA